MSDALKCPVISTVSTKSSNNGLPELIEAVVTAGKSGKKQLASGPWQSPEDLYQG